MAGALNWKLGEGFDIHVLRGGAASKSLAGALQLEANAVASTLQFVGQFAPLPGKGITVDATTGVVVATPPPPATTRIEINNFLVVASVKDTDGNTHAAKIRVHVHDAILDVWLTPPTLTVRMDSNSSQFTVLAAFSDGVIGDITDWRITYRSREPATSSPSAHVQVASDGKLKALTPNQTAAVSVEVVALASLTNPVIVTSAPANVLTLPNWTSAAATAKVSFVETAIRPRDPRSPLGPGIVVPNKADPSGTARDSVASVVANAPNILLVAEGFKSETEFNDVVKIIVNDLRTLDMLIPFKLLQDSINYWSVFIPSHDDDVTLLGDFIVHAGGYNELLPGQRTPSLTATSWTFEEMMHDVGLPILGDPVNLSDIEALWTSRYGSKTYGTLAAANFQRWRSISRASLSRLAVLDERDTAFGMRNHERPRADRTFGGVQLGSDSRRRTPDADIFKFIQSLSYGTGASPGNVGSNWGSGNKDAGRICFVCRTQKHSGQNWGGYFLASTGRGSPAVRSMPRAGGATSFEIVTAPVTKAEKLGISSVVAHETSHSLGLADEYGDGAGTFRDADHHEGNLVPKKDITTTTATTPPQTVYSGTISIKWLWPRVAKAALLRAKPTSLGSSFKVTFRKGQGTAFKVNDVVRFRRNPVAVAPIDDDLYNFGGAELVVIAEGADEVLIRVGTPALPLDLPRPPPDTRTISEELGALLTSNPRVALICPVVPAIPGTGLLVADVIRTHIAATHGPLNAPAGNTTGRETQVCKANYSGTMTPMNLPALKTKPRAPQDIIGLYEGGGGHDCGVFRPAGRCKMRNSHDLQIPFCHVCRYIIVDLIDPTRHDELDKCYPLVAP